MSIERDLYQTEQEDWALEQISEAPYDEYDYDYPVDDADDIEEDEPDYDDSADMYEYDDYAAEADAAADREARW